MSGSSPLSVQDAQELFLEDATSFVIAAQNRLYDVEQLIVAKAQPTIQDLQDQSQTLMKLVLDTDRLLRGMDECLASIEVRPDDQAMAKQFAALCDQVAVYHQNATILSKSIDRELHAKLNQRSILAKLMGWV